MVNQGWSLVSRLVGPESEKNANNNIPIGYPFGPSVAKRFDANHMSIGAFTNNVFPLKSHVYTNLYGIILICVKIQPRYCSIMPLAE